MAPIIYVTREELIAQRAEILKRINFPDQQAFDQVCAARSLSDDEWHAKQELDDITFLLGADE